MFRRILFILVLLFAGSTLVTTAAQQAAKPAAIPARDSANAVLPPALEAPAAKTENGPLNAALGSIQGVVVDRDGVVYEGAQVTLASTVAYASGGSGPGIASVQTTSTDSNGQFSFAGVPAGAFRLTVSSSGFATQVVAATLRPGESYDTRAIVLAMKGASSEVRVNASQNEIASEQLRQEEKQYVMGVMPNFYVSYVPNAPPLSTRQKFDLAWKSMIDPFNFAMVGAAAGVQQASNSFAGYGRGVRGYARRYGAGFADSSVDNFIGGAFLSSWWKQDPRYFYKGTGTTRSRVLYAIANSVICRGDNGHWQVDYSAIAGGLAAAGISNLYYPAGSRAGVALTFENLGVGFASNAGQNLLQEFLIRRLTPRVPNYGGWKP